jgi:hypothetical protein
LSKFQLNVSKEGISLPALQLLLDILPRSSRLIDVTLRLPSQGNDVAKVCSQLDLSPLLQLAHLTRFDWSALFNDIKFDGAAAGHPMSAAQLGIVKQIPSLRSLHCNDGEWIEEEIQLAFQLPHRLQQLQYVDLSNTELNAAMLSCLVSLPALSELRPLRLLPEAYPLLARFPQLRSLYLSMQYPEPTAVELSSLCEVCTWLQDFSLNDVRSVPLISAFLTELRGGAMHPECIYLTAALSMPPEDAVTLLQLQKEWNNTR